MQASSALSERVFVKASLLLSNFRTAMDPTIAEKIIFVSENWHHWNNVDLLKAVHEKKMKRRRKVKIDATQGLQVCIRIRNNK